MKGYPKWFSPVFISSILGFLFLSGILLAPTTLQLRFDWEMPWRLEAESKIWVAAVHTFYSLLTIAVVGALASVHMRQEWRRGRNRLSGISLVVSMAFLSLTGIGIFYFGNELLSRFSSLSHLIVGLLIFGLYVWHLIWAKIKGDEKVQGEKP